ncbi:hypothetical protein PSPTOT1_2833 [Pseudomonas syringae pv. tomato T1]|nr:hypothetical protein PSPTOT1_2833 [Pseudomonas syringae pv. tomato T1]
MFRICEEAIGFEQVDDPVSGFKNRRCFFLVLAKGTISKHRWHKAWSELFTGGIVNAQHFVTPLVKPESHACPELRGRVI